MSGTSLDGLDIAHIKFHIGSKISFEILSPETIEYSDFWRAKLKYQSHKNEEELKSLDHEYAILLAREIQNFFERHQIEAKNIDLIASHGHTIYHQPEKGYTLQIGNGPEIFNRHKIPLVCDFRVQDIQLGGQGAPLVPIGDQLLFGNYEACLNFGGFVNISFEKNGSRLAMDVCPLNYVSNSLSQNLGLAYDEDGNLARKGNIIFPLLETLNKLEYYQVQGPKTLGAEWVEEQINPVLEKFDITIQDKLRTFLEHAAIQISNIIEEHTISNALFTGGGVYNSFLIDLIRSKTECQISIPEKELIEFKEALIFGLLGLLRLQGKTNVLASVTGAKKDHSSGKIYI